ncbi:MAG: GH3 auxin-responsive promoter family protein [Thermoleophilia bacterium]
MALIQAALVLREGFRDARFEAATRDPARAQARVLARLLARNRDTAFGREHRFAALAGAADYRTAVPMRDYEGFRPYVRQMLAGQGGVLTAAPPVMFTITSGSTGEPKMIPVTAAWREELAQLNRLWLLRALRDHRACLDGKTLFVASPAVEGHTEGGVPLGAMSGVSYQRMPWVVRRQASIPYAVCLLADYQARYFATVRLALGASLSIIATPNPSTLIRLAETLRAHGPAMVRAVADGTLGLPGAPVFGAHVDAEARAKAEAQLAAALRPDPARARALEAVLAAHGELRPAAVWPALRLIGCWLGGSAGLQAGGLARHYGDVPLRDLGLIASEGRMTIPVEDGSPAGVLAVHRNFYEFVAEEGIEDAAPPVALAHELEVGRRYYLVLTGGNGLYRYDINDIVEVRGFHNRTPQVAFVRKGRDVASITGEKLHLNHVQAGVRAAERRLGVQVWQLALIPDVEASRYHLLVELAGALPLPSADAAFLETFEATVAGLNEEYAQKRASARLRAPQLHWMRAGWSEAASRAEFGRGRCDFQFKWQVMRERWDDASRAHVARASALEPAAP